MSAAARKRESAAPAVRTFTDGAGWRFTLAATEGGFELRTLSRSLDWAQHHRDFAERNKLAAPRRAKAAIETAERAERGVFDPEFRETQWLTEWLKAGLIREVRS